jgi:hypothetical protein
MKTARGHLVETKGMTEQEALDYMRRGPRERRETLTPSSARKLLKRLKKTNEEPDAYDVVNAKSQESPEHDFDPGVSRSQLIRKWVNDLMERGMTEQEAFDYIDRSL